MPAPSAPARRAAARRLIPDRCRCQGRRELADRVPGQGEEHLVQRLGMDLHVVDADSLLVQGPHYRAGQPWEDWLAEVARTYRALLLSHRDGARLVASTRPLPDSLPLLDGRTTPGNDGQATPGARNRQVAS
jgi:tetracycline repressor-like protein